MGGGFGSSGMIALAAACLLAAACSTTSPAEPDPSSTPRPAIEVDGRVAVAIESPAVTLDGAAKCDIPEGAEEVRGVRVNEAGQIGGHRIYVSLTFGSDRTGAQGELATLEIGQGMENLPPDGGLLQYSGPVDVTAASIANDATTGSLPFASLPLDGAAFAGVDWPDAISGTIEWTCDPIPAGPTPAAPGASGAAKLTGAISGIFALEGGDCPTPDLPDGFMSGIGTLDTGEAILEVTVWPDGTASFVLYPTPGDKNSAISATGPASIEPAGDGWATSLKAALTPIGPVTLDVAWSCGG